MVETSAVINSSMLTGVLGTQRDSVPVGAQQDPTPPGPLQDPLDVSIRTLHVILSLQAAS